MFDRKFMREGKVIDLSLLPPCRSVLYLHMLQANYVAKIWRSALISMIDYANIVENGWMENGEIVWVDDIFPNDIEEILIDEKNLMKRKWNLITRHLTILMMM